MALGHRIIRQVVGAKLQSDIAALGNGYCIGQSLRAPGKEFRHFTGGFEIELVTGEAHAVGIIHMFCSLYAQQHIVGLGILLGQVVQVIGGHQGNPRLAADFRQVLVDGFLLHQSVVLDL